MRLDELEAYIYRETVDALRDGVMLNSIDTTVLQQNISDFVEGEFNADNLETFEQIYGVDLLELSGRIKASNR